jgi:hypothetical protein
MTTKDDLVKEMMEKIIPGKPERNFAVAFEFMAEKIAELMNEVETLKSNVKKNNNSIKNIKINNSLN